MARRAKGGAGSLDALAEAIKRGQKAPRVSTLWDEIQQAFGGPVGFAKEIKACYDAATPGSPTRARMMSLLLDLHSQAAAATAGGDPLSGITNAELDSAMKGLLRGLGPSDNESDQDRQAPE